MDSIGRSERRGTNRGVQRLRTRLPTGSRIALATRELGRGKGARSREKSFVPKILDPVEIEWWESFLEPVGMLIRD
jgi:hypothetical protein